MANTQSVVTIQHVAARAGVSAMTVSRVINNRTSVAPTTRQRVEQAIDDLGYVPNALARGLLHGRTRTIALIVSDISNPFFTQVARGVEDIAQRNGYAVLLGNSDESVDKERQYVNVMLQNRVDGLLIAPSGPGSRKGLDFLKRHGAKFVLLDRDVEGITADTVEGDSVVGAQLLCEHLLRLGHRRIALVNGPRDVSTARDRLLGYQAALRAFGVETDPVLIIESNYKRDGGNRAARQLLELPPEERPTATFASNNLMGVGLIETLRGFGVNVPGDMAIVCFDDVEHASALHPFLTVMAQPARTFGTIAAQFLLDRIDGAESSPSRKVVLRPELIVRLSCGATLAEAKEAVAPSKPSA